MMFGCFLSIIGDDSINDDVWLLVVVMAEEGAFKGSDLFGLLFTSCVPPVVVSKPTPGFTEPADFVGMTDVVAAEIKWDEVSKERLFLLLMSTLPLPFGWLFVVVDGVAIADVVVVAVDATTAAGSVILSSQSEFILLFLSIILISLFDTWIFIFYDFRPLVSCLDYY